MSSLPHFGLLWQPQDFWVLPDPCVLAVSSVGVYVALPGATVFLAARVSCDSKWGGSDSLAH